MNCSEARFALGADPAGRDSAVAEHLQACEACLAYAREMQQLDQLLHDAMSVPVPDLELPAGPYAVESDADVRASLGSGATPAARPMSVRARSPANGGSWAQSGRRFALAASVAGVAVLAGLLWIGVPRESLATAVVEHMAEEPNAWETTTTLPGVAVDKVLARSGVRLEPGRMDVTYAHSCWFRGRFVPHLVVQTTQGPVTVVVLPREDVSAPVEFREHGYNGMLVPAKRGSIAVLTRDRADVDATAAKVLAAMAYID